MSKSRRALQAGAAGLQTLSRPADPEPALTRPLAVAADEVTQEGLSWAL